MPEPALAPVPLFPPLIIAAYIACIAGAGALANCALLAALLKRLKNGLFVIIIQLAVSDFLLLGTSIGPELWSNNTKTWVFGQLGCAAYRGLGVFTSTLSLYFTVMVALHTLATANLEKKATVLKTKRNEGDDDEEIKSSRHSLVASSVTSTPPRTMNVDYRVVNTNVAVARPSFFVWVLATSLSIPEFSLATTVHHQNITGCTLVDTSHRVIMHSMIALFNFFLPVFILTTAGAMIICHLTQKHSKLGGKDTISELKLSLCLICVYLIFCAPRSLLYIYRLYKLQDSHKIDIEYDNTILTINLLFSAIHLAAALLRPLLCVSLIPRLRKMFCFGYKNIDKV